MNFEQTLHRHHARSVPIILIDGAIDELATGRQVLDALEPHHNIAYIWSCSEGIETSSKSREFAAAAKYLDAAKSNPDIGPYTTNPDVALRALKHIMYEVDAARKDESVGVLMYMGDRILGPENADRNTVVQLLMDMRDVLKVNQSCVYLVGITFNVPPELKEHIIVLNAPMPTKETYVSKIEEVTAKLKETTPGTDFDLTEDKRESYVSILRGTSEFAAEQMLYLATDEAGIDGALLRERAIQTINSTKGLSVHKGDGRGFDAIGGLDGIKDYARSLLAGRLDLRCIVYADEVEKTLSGATGGDTSGVSGNFLGKWLSEIQDTNALGLLCTGIPGCAKSEFAKRLGEEADALTINFDLAGMKDSLVGNSEANLSRALRTIREIGGTEGGILYIATSNRIAHLPPEFRRRFNLGTFFFSFPDDTEQTVIVEIYIDRYKLTPEQDDRETFSMPGWTGAEIESCCRLAHLMDCKLSEAARFVVPVKETAKEEIEKLIDQANGRFLDASHGGVFTKPMRSAAKTTRKSSFN
jgi:hypothetical protein